MGALCAGVICGAAVAQGAGWTVTSTVQQLVVTYDGWVNVRLSPDLVGCTSHSNYGPQFASIPVSHPGFAAMQANLLTAYVTGTPVALYLSDANCTVAEMRFAPQ